MFRLIRSIISPARGILSELRIIRELYELELEAQGIRRITERPNRTDTEVFYTGEQIHKKTFREWLTRQEAADAESELESELEE